MITASDLIAFASQPELPQSSPVSNVISESDLIAIILSLLAIWIAVLAYWKSFGTWVRLIEASGAASTTVYENNLEMFHYYTVSIRNSGLPLHDLSVYLRFETTDKECRSIFMQPVEYRNERTKVAIPDVFAHGMIGTFTLRSYSPNIAEFLRRLDCPRMRNARLAIMSQGYLAAEIPLWCRFYWLRSLWNRLAWKFKSLFYRTRTLSDGSEVLFQGKFLPLFDTNKHFRLQCFVRGMATRHKDGNESSGMS